MHLKRWTAVRAARHVVTLAAVLAAVAPNAALAQRQSPVRVVLDSVAVHLFLEDSGTLSPDVSVIADFAAFNFVASGTGVPPERFHDILVAVTLTSAGEAFARGRQATVTLTDLKTRRVIESRQIADVYVGRSGRVTKPLWFRDRSCQPLEIRVTGAGKAITKTLQMSCGE
jgi:hypothetical protein